MNDFLEEPLGDFTWGPDGRLTRIRHRLASWLTRSRVYLLLIAVGAALLALGISIALQ